MSPQPNPTPPIPKFDFHSVILFFWENSAAIKKHWVLFAVAVGTCSFIAGCSVRLFDSRQIDILTTSNTQLRDYNNSLIQSAGATAGSKWGRLSIQEALALRDNLRPIAPARLGVLCGIPACADLAESIYDTAHDLDWPAIYASTYMNNGIQPGIEIWSYPEVLDTRNKIADAIEHATNGRLKISRHEWPAAQLPPDILNGINLVIGRLK